MPLIGLVVYVLILCVLKQNEFCFIYTHILTYLGKVFPTEQLRGRSCNNSKEDEYSSECVQWWGEVERPVLTKSGVFFNQGNSTLYIYGKLHLDGWWMDGNGMFCLLIQ